MHTHVPSEQWTSVSVSVLVHISIDIDIDTHVMASRRAANQLQVGSTAIWGSGILRVRIRDAYRITHAI